MLIRAVAPGTSEKSSSLRTQSCGLFLRRGQSFFQCNFLGKNVKSSWINPILPSVVFARNAILEALLQTYLRYPFILWLDEKQQSWTFFYMLKTFEKVSKLCFCLSGTVFLTKSQESNDFMLVSDQKQRTAVVSSACTWSSFDLCCCEMSWWCLLRKWY